MPPSHLRRGAGLRMRGPGLETGLGGVRRGGGATGPLQRSFSATPPPQPGPQPSRRPSPPGREPGPPARSANFFFPFAKTFSRSCHRRTAAVPAHFPPISFLQAVLEDEVGWLEVREGVPGLWHPQDPQDPPPPLRDPILPTTPPSRTRCSWWAVNPGADSWIGCPRRGLEPEPGKH